MALTKFRAAPLPNPPAQYDPQYIRQFIRVLETYFSQLDSNTPNYADSYTALDFYGSGIHLTFPYGQFTSLVDQSAASTDTAYPVTYSQSDFNDGILLQSGSQLVVPHTAIYNVTFSLQFQNTVNDVEYVDLWFRVNGTDVANSNSQFSLPARKSTGTASSLIAATSVMLSLQADDYIQLMWRTSNTGVSMQHLPAISASGGVTPAIPATPSAFVQVEFVSLS